MPHDEARAGESQAVSQPDEHPADAFPLRFRGAWWTPPRAMVVKPIAVAEPRSTLEFSVVEFIQPGLDYKLRCGHSRE